MNLDLEKAIIGSMVWNYDSLEKGLRLLEPEDFSVPINSELFGIIKDLKADNIDPGLININNEVAKRKNVPRKEAFLGYVEDLVKTESVSAHFDSYVVSLLERRKRDKLKEAGVLLQDYSEDGSMNVGDIVRDIEKRIEEMNDRDPQAANVDEHKTVNDLQSRDSDYLKTGFNSIDELTYGLCKGELVILAARPSVGKTALALNIARNVSEDRGVLFYSFEMSKRDLRLRLLASECEINMNRIKFDVLDEIERGETEAVYQKIRKLNLDINESSSLSVDDIVNLSMGKVKYKKVDFVVIDYLTLIKTIGNQNRYLQIGEITRSLKRLAKDMGVPILLLAQLGRGVEAREKQKPRLSDLRESGDIEQDADKVFFLYQPDQESEDIDLLVAKNRNGAVGKVSLKFIKQFTKFRDW